LQRAGAHGPCYMTARRLTLRGSGIACPGRRVRD
jgi:hypothetical protein